MTQATPEALLQQIDQLQQQLETARAQTGGEANAPYERQEVHAALGEQIQQIQNSVGAVPQTGASQPASDGDLPSYQDPNLAPQVQALVNVAFTQGVQVAIDQALKTGNSALIDALHDVLADELHQELLNRQKLKPAA